jgi:hypothetical protein
MDNYFDDETPYKKNLKIKNLKKATTNIIIE